MGSRLGVHHLAMEDCANRNQRAKIDDYESHQLVVWYMLSGGHLYELQFIIFKDELVAVPHQPPPKETTWQDFLRIAPDTKDVWHLLYQALDHTTDVTWADLVTVFHTIDKCEEQMMVSGLDPQQLLSLKKNLNRISMTLSPLASVTTQLIGICNPHDDLRWKLRDLHDHCERISRSVELYRSQISSIIEVHWGFEANRTNHQIKRLSLLAGVVTPITFWASFWGMNFEAIPFESKALFWSALALMVASAFGTRWLLVRKGYWKD